MSEIREIDDLNFEAEVLASEMPFVLTFSATWCGPCKALTPMLATLARDRASELKVGKLDIDGSPATAARYAIRGAPTIIVFHAGRERARRVGSGTRRTLDTLIAEGTRAPVRIPRAVCGRSVSSASG